MNAPASAVDAAAPAPLSVFERWLTLWVALCIVAGVVLGQVFGNSKGVPNDLRAIFKAGYAAIRGETAIARPTGAHFQRMDLFGKRDIQRAHQYPWAQ